jgi:cell wall-associated NlpC family hydrolase
MAAIRSVNPGLLMIGFILLATLIAASSLMAQTPRRRHTLTVFTTGIKPHSPLFAPGIAGAKLALSPTAPPPSPLGGPVISSAPAAPPVPPVGLILANQAPPATPAPIQAPPPVQAPAPSSEGDTAVAYALRQLGKRYVYGAAGDSAFDCSGLVMRAWQAAGVSLPRTTYDMARVGTRISRSQLQPGDLVFMYNYGHVTLYIGDGNMVEAPHAGAVVRIRSLPSDVNAYVRVSSASV